MRTLAASFQLQRQNQSGREVQPMRVQSSGPQIYPYRPRIATASSGQFQRVPVSIDQVPGSQDQHARTQSLPFRPRIVPASLQATSDDQRFLPATFQVTSAHPQVLSPRHQILPISHQLIPAHSHIMSSHPQTKPVRRQIMPGQCQTAPARHQIRPYRHRIPQAIFSRFAVDISARLGIQIPESMSDPSQPGDIVSTNSPGQDSDSSENSTEPAKKKRGRPIKKYVPGTPMTQYAKAKMRKEKKKLQAKLLAPGPADTSACDPSSEIVAANILAAQEFSKLVAATTSATSPVRVVANHAAEQSPVLDPALAADDQARDFDGPTGTKSLLVTLRHSPRPDTKPGISQSKKRRR